MESAAWYKDVFGLHMTDKRRQTKKIYADPEQLYDLDGPHLVNTIFGNDEINKNKGKGYAGIPSAASFNLGTVKTAGVIDVNNDSDNMSTLSTTTKDELIALLRKTKLSSSKNKDPVPTAKGSLLYASDSKDSHSSSDSSSGSSSSSSDEEPEAGRRTGGR